MLKSNPHSNIQLQSVPDSLFTLILGRKTNQSPQRASRGDNTVSSPGIVFKRKIIGSGSVEVPWTWFLA